MRRKERERKREVKRDRDREMKWVVMTCKEKRILQMCQCGIEKKTKRVQEKWE